MQDKDLSIGLQSRVRNYIEWLIERQQSNGGWENQMMHDLSKNLKGELFFIINSKVIKEISWIETYFSENLINLLIF